MFYPTSLKLGVNSSVALSMTVKVRHATQVIRMEAVKPAQEEYKKGVTASVRKELFAQIKEDIKSAVRDYTQESILRDLRRELK